MNYESIFDFLNEDDKRFADVHSICISMEKSIISNSYNASLILSRTASEQLIKIIVKSNKKLNKRFYKDTDDFPSYNSMLYACKDDKVIKYKVFKKYDELKKMGNANVHGQNLSAYGIEHAKKAHKFLYDIAIECYNRFNVTKDNIYKYKLKDYDFNIEISSDERKKQIDNVRFEEISQENLINSFEFREIFIPITNFKSIVAKYSNKINDSDKFEETLDDLEFISNENLDLIDIYFDESVRSDVILDIHKLHDNISNDVIKTLNELNKSQFTFKELNDFIEESKDSNSKEIFTCIKLAADDLVKTYMEEYKKEIESSPIVQLAKNGRKLLKYKNYNIVEDDFGFGLEEVEENILLDDDQEMAVEYDGDKPLVVNAGPGSGKTRVIIERVVHLVNKTKKPESILVITFTRKATQELRDRLINETDLDLNDINQIRISTVHGFCRYLISKYEPVPYNYLTRHGERSLFFKKHKHDLGFKKYAFLYDKWIPKVLEKYDEYFNFKVDGESLLDCLSNKMAPFESNNKRYRRYIDNFYKDNEIDVCPVMEQLRHRKISSPGYYYRWMNIVNSYPQFLKLMRNSSTCDENTVLSKANELLENDFILNQLQYKNILIDEFQDTDHSQKNIFEKLLKISDSFTIVGDIDQSIYGWRGAFPEYFEEFRKKDVEYITLHTNYRSSRDIVEFNEELIKDYRDIEKDLKSKKKYNAPIYQLTSKDKDDEALKIALLIEALMNEKKIKYYSDVAVLFRRNADIENVIKYLDSKDIKYFLKENNDFLDQNEVKAMLILFWYIMPYDKYKLYHLGDEFLNFIGLTNDSLNEIFRLTEDTRILLRNIEETFQKTLIRNARTEYSKKYGYQRNFEYAKIFDLDDDLKEKIFENIEIIDFSTLDKQGLIDIGITNENDLNFFLKLNNLKSTIFNESHYSNKITTLRLFYELLNITDYFSEISLDNNPDDVKIKDNLALFSHIIKDYESIMGDYEYVGLFTYLNRVLKGYSCRHNESDEGFNKVHLLSMHSAKGLQYPVVIVGSIKQGLCPLNYNPDKGVFTTPNKFLEFKDNNIDIDKNKYLKEEMRTLYVATTRAKEVLILSTIGDNPNDCPDFLSKLKRNPNVNIKLLEHYNTSNIPKIQSSKVFKKTNDFPKVKFEDIIDDFLFCETRYDLANNTRFKVKLRNDKYVNMVLHRLLNNVHDDENVTVDSVNEKINTILNYHNISKSSSAFEILQNVRYYWDRWGSKYQIIDKNVKLLTQLKYCDLTSVIDLIIKEDDGASIVHFIGSDANIPNIELYKATTLYYMYVLKNQKKYEDYKFKKIYIHSLENNNRHEIEYNEEFLSFTLQYLEDATKSIHDNVFNRFRNNCSICEYKDIVCKG